MFRKLLNKLNFYTRNEFYVIDLSENDTKFGLVSKLRQLLTSYFVKAEFPPPPPPAWKIQVAPLRKPILGTQGSILPKEIFGSWIAVFFVFLPPTTGAIMSKVRMSKLNWQNSKCQKFKMSKTKMWNGQKVKI